MQTIQSETGIEVTYDCDGDGPPLILLHGGMAPKEYWTPIVPYLDGYTTIIPQRPGFGTCPESLAELTADDVLNREVKYVQTLVEDIDRDPILFGHSYGALTAIEAATKVPVTAVVAYEPAILPAEYRETANLADQMQTRIEAGKPGEAIKQYIELVLHPGGIDDLDAWLSDWPVWPDCIDLADEVLRMNRAVERYQLPPSLDVTAPVLTLTGTNGPDFLRKSARDTHVALSQSRLVEFDSVSHAGPAEAPDVLSSEIETFLRAHSPRSRD
ncbi:alpha/beta fold hydrolase [Natronolimnobius baerhuensis]|uniref:Alpha/beta hydrolase n=1 Tax=Natronolimnobius baerhuensis TaxID=253108 RepID=A0A202EB99_9EURY|nr:alpha/beta hydrolase [Natronolimnobius baerhuensis]OVE85497.1 alpha/beta hydrolase [Natronolimnobius baerhuensis]